MKLYCLPGACSLAPHIVIHELGLPYELRIVKRGDEQAWAELKALNPMGQVPTIVTNEGYPLAEGAAIMQYLVSQKPNSLFPEAGQSRFKAFEWMNFIATGLHKGFSPLFGPGMYSENEAHAESIKNSAIKNLSQMFKVAEGKFSEGDFALGNQFTVVDAYLFTILNWTGHFKLDLSPYRKLSAFMQRMMQRPSVVAAMKAEGLLGK